MKKLSEGKQLTPHDLAKLSKVKAKLEIIGGLCRNGEGEGSAERAFKTLTARAEARGP
jgi:hypothetical protein